MTANGQFPPIDGEPDFETGTLEEWIAYRDRLEALPRGDHTVRLAIAVADAQIVRIGQRRATQHSRRKNQKTA